MTKCDLCTKFADAGGLCADCVRKMRKSLKGLHDTGMNLIAAVTGGGGDRQQALTAFANEIPEARRFIGR